jgi:tripartite-type tricarboxylate transporter receptor subunit TctC
MNTLHQTPSITYVFQRILNPALKKFPRLLAVAAAAACISEIAFAQSAKPWPSDRPIQIHVGQQAGYAPDLVSRWLGEALSKELGQNVVIINKPVGGGRPMMNELKRATPDGYVFANVFWHMTSAWPALFSNLEFNPAEDFSYIGTWMTGPQMVVTYPGSGITDLKHALEDSKKQPKPVQYGTYGATSPGAIYMAYATSQTKANMESVHFKAGDAVVAMSRKDVPLLIGGVIDVQEQIKAGALVPLAVSGRERLSAYPSVPTFAELGVKGLEAGVWTGLIGPPGLPKDIVDKMNAALRRAVAHPELRTKLESTSRFVWVTSPKEMQDHIRAEIPIWSKTIKDAGIKIQ